VADTQSESTTTTQTTSTTTTPDISTKVGHVFVIALPGSAYDATFAGLRPQGRLLSGYAPLADNDLPDYIAAISGQPPNAATKAGCATPGDFPSSAKPNDQGVVAGDGCVYPVDAITLADQITGKGKVWKAYIEGQTQACTPGPENPFAYFHSLLDLGACSTGEVPLDQLAGDLTSGKKTPAFSFIVPTSPLSQLTPQILGSPAYKKDGLLVISYGAHPGGTLLLSPFVKAGGDDASPYNAYSLLRTVDDIFGVSPLAEAGGDGVKPFKGVVTGSGV
jgi:hypothetical protein